MGCGGAENGSPQRHAEIARLRTVVLETLVVRKGCAARSSQVWTHDADDHDRFMAVLRGVPAWRPAEPDDPDEDDRKRTQRSKPAKPRWEFGCSGRARQSSQRRIVAELAHELPLDAQERALRAWCERTFGDTGCTWHAVIHQPEGSNDPRNWHAHIVYTTCAIGREVNADRRETGRFDFESGSTMPKMVDMGIVLDGNGPKKRSGMRDLVRKWRADMAEEQNAELGRAGIEKHYDPRSYRAQGIDLEATTHHGASRSAWRRADAGRCTGVRRPHANGIGSRKVWSRTSKPNRSDRSMQSEFARCWKSFGSKRDWPRPTQARTECGSRKCFARRSCRSERKKWNAIPQRSCSSTPSRTHAERCVPVWGNWRG